MSRKPYTMVCLECKQEFDTVSIKAMSSVMRRHAKHHPGVAPIRYKIRRSPGKTAEQKLKDQSTVIRRRPKP